jgi:arylsulfatase A-like enzyme
VRLVKLIDVARFALSEQIGDWFLWHVMGDDPRISLWGSRNRKNAARINRDALRWISAQRGRPFFAFLNCIDAHDAYIPPRGADGRFGREPANSSERALIREWERITDDVQESAKLSRAMVELARDCYDDCLAYLDDQLGRLLDELERQALLQNTIVFITSDHGEHFGEHDGSFGHNRTLYSQETRVPLVVIAPGRVPEGKIVTAPVSLRDLAATVDDLVAGPSGGIFPGRSLARCWAPVTGGEPIEARPVLSGNEEAGRAVKIEERFRQSLTIGEQVYIRNTKGEEELYNIALDPGQAHNLAGSSDARSTLEHFRAAMKQFFAENTAASGPEPVVARRDKHGLDRAVERKTRIAASPRVTRQAFEHGGQGGYDDFRSSQAFGVNRERSAQQRLMTFQCRRLLEPIATIDESRSARRSREGGAQSRRRAVPQRVCCGQRARGLSMFSTSRSVRRFALVLVCMAPVVGSESLLAADKSTRLPNIILVVADDLGWGDVGFNGRTDWLTPNLDRLAKQGRVFARCYTAAVVCAPSRGAFLTGKSTIHSGVRRNDEDLPAEEVTIAEALRPLGYSTALFGKWHHGEPRVDRADYVHPLDQGFEQFFGYTDASLAWEKFPKQLWDGRRLIAVSGYIDDLITERAVAFVENHRARPFFLYLAYVATHFNIEAPADEVARHRGKFIEADPAIPLKATYAAMVTRLDWNIGRLVETLKRLGMDRQTLIVFTSDQGATFEGGNRGTSAALDSNRPFRGQKRTLWEGGVRVPLVACWPGHIPAGDVARDVIQLIDLLPTFLAAAGASVNLAWHVDGLNVLPVWTGKAPAPERTLFWEWQSEGCDQMAALRGRFKLVVSHGGKPELYDVESDPGERRDASAQYPELTQKLRDELSAWLKTETRR